MSDVPRPRLRLVVFTRHPEPGRVKTRLIPALGAEGAAAVHRRLALRAVRTAREACRRTGALLEVRFDGGDADTLRHWLGPEGRFQPQGTGDLGDRLLRCLEQSVGEGTERTVIVGSDCPGLTPALLASAFAALDTRPVVFGPATDGGYYLLGCRTAIPALFRDIPWGTGDVLAASLRALRPLTLEPALLEPLPDVDLPSDLAAWRAIGSAEEQDLRRVSVILPTLNEGPRIGDALGSVFPESPWEVFVADGGSTDDTCARAEALGATVVRSAAGRASQMNAAAAAATGSVLLFLHADTRLPRGWKAFAARALESPGVVAGAFRLRIADPFPGRRFVEGATHVRSRLLRLPYGDQGLFVTRADFEELGGFPNLPILEDFELVRRLNRRGRVITLPEPAQTSGRRWRRLGVVRTTLINQAMIAGYLLGVPIARLARFYRQDRTPEPTATPKPQP